MYMQMTQGRRYNNQQLADVFDTIADLLEIKGEVIYKTLAYRKAADNLRNLGRDINEVWREGDLTDIPGVGKAIASKIEELLTTGHLDFLDTRKSGVQTHNVAPIVVDHLINF